MNSSNNTVTYSVIIFIVVIIVLLCWKILLPNYFDSKAALETAKTSLDQDKTKLSSIQKAKADLDGLGTIKEKIFVAYSRDEDSPNLITELEAIAMKNNIVIPNIDIEKESGAVSGNSQIVISFSVSGNFEQLSALIVSLEKSIKYMDIKSISFGGSEGDQYSLSVQLSAYTSEPAETNDESSELEGAE